MSEERVERCERCRFWEKLSESQIEAMRSIWTLGVNEIAGNCRRYPPLMGLAFAKADGWCGEFQHKGTQ